MSSDIRRPPPFAYHVIFTRYVVRRPRTHQPKASATRYPTLTPETRQRGPGNARIAAASKRVFGEARRPSSSAALHANARTLRCANARTRTNATATSESQRFSIVEEFSFFRPPELPIFPGLARSLRVPRSRGWTARVKRGKNVSPLTTKTADSPGSVRPHDCRTLAALERLQADLC